MSCIGLMVVAIAFSVVVLKMENDHTRLKKIIHAGLPEEHSDSVCSYRKTFASASRWRDVDLGGTER